MPGKTDEREPRDDCRPAEVPFRRRYRATQGRGFQPDASDCFLKSVVVTNGLPR